MTYDEMEETKSIAREICKNETGREYDSVDTYEDAKFMQVHAKAAELRFMLMKARRPTPKPKRFLFKAKDFSQPNRELGDDE